jgi:hypothetical protein
MPGRSPIPAAACLILALASARVAAAGDPSPSEVREAVDRALPPILAGAAGSIQKRECFTCHHQAVPVVALTLARRRGVAVEDGAVRAQVEHTAADLAGAADAYRSGRGQGGGVSRAGYALWTLEAGALAPDATTAAVAEFLLLRDADRDHWRTSSRRPPSEASDFTATALALRGLRAFGTPAQQDRIASRVTSGARLAGGDPRAGHRGPRLPPLGPEARRRPRRGVRDAARQLADSRRDDGGWAQLADRDSDAYATGSALVALHLAGGMPTDDPVYGAAWRS